jgi:hypothetical protein
MGCLAVGGDIVAAVAADTDSGTEAVAAAAVVATAFAFVIEFDGGCWLLIAAVGNDDDGQLSNSRDPINAMHL